MTRLYTTVAHDVEVDIDLDELEYFELEEIIEERGIVVIANEVKADLETIYEKFRRGQNIDRELRAFFYITLGRIA